MKKIILASASPRRQELLSNITTDFTVCPADADETLPEGLSIEKQIETLAKRKAEAVLEQNPDKIVIGSDTMVVVDNKPLGKPKDKEDAIRMLKMLSGRKHKVITGVAVLCKEKKLINHRTTKVKFRVLTEHEIESYVATGEPMDKAGAYGIQGLGSVLVEGIEGDYFSVVGLPVSLVYTMLCEIEHYMSH